MTATASTTLTTSASIETGSTVDAASVTVTATRQATTPGAESTYAHILVVGIGFLAGAGGKATAVDSGDVTAAVADGVEVTTGVMVVRATSTTLTRGFAQAGGLAGVAVVVPIVHATHSADTLASVGADTGVQASSLTIEALATTTVRIDIATAAVGLVGGAVGDATAESTGLTEARLGAAFDTSSPANPRQVVVSGAVLVRAGVEQRVTGDTTGAAVGGLAVGGLMVRAFADGSTRAFLGNGVRVQSGSLTVQVTGVTTPDAIRTATAKSVVGTVALIGGGGSSSTAAIRGSLDAFIGAAADVIVVGDVIVTATGTATASADAEGGGFGGITINAFFATATVAPAGADPIGTRASIGAGASVTGRSVRVAATGVDSATAKVVAVGVGLLTGAGGSANATVNSDVEAFIGPRSDTATNAVQATGGAVDVIATATQTATATGQGGGGGVFVAASLNATAGVASAVQAMVRGGTLQATGAVTVRATQTATVDATLSAGGVGVFTTAPGINATASHTGDVLASIVGTAVTSGGALTVEGLLIADVDAVVSAGGGGVISVTTTWGTPPSAVRTAPRSVPAPPSTPAAPCSSTPTPRAGPTPAPRAATSPVWGSRR